MSLLISLKTWVVILPKIKNWLLGILSQIVNTTEIKNSYGYSVEIWMKGPKRPLTLQETNIQIDWQIDKLLNGLSCPKVKSQWKYMAHYFI